MPNSNTTLRMPQRQRGVATVLLVILIAIALTATSLGMMHSVRNTQEKHLAVHAATHAQTGAWAGAEAFRLFLTKVSETELLALNGLTGIGFNIPSDTTSTLMANNVVVEQPSPGTYIVHAEILNKHVSAKATAALGVTYRVTPGAAPVVNSPGALDFYYDLDATGGITLLAPEGQLPNINVDGNVNIDQLTVTELGELRATGSLSLGSGVNADVVYANGDVMIKDTVSVEEVRTLGNFTAYGSATAGIVWANHDVLIESAGRFEAVNAVGDIEVTMGNHGFFKTGGEFTLGASAGDIEEVLAKGDIDLNAWSVLGRAVGEGNINCVDAGWSDFAQISVNGSVGADCPPVGSTGLDIAGGRNNSVPVMTPLTPFTMTPLVVDVWPLKDKANFVIEYDEMAARPKITVSNIAGVADGSEFFIADYDPGTAGGYYNDYLCSATDPATGFCTAPALPTATLCLGHAVENGCIDYDPASATWNINGTSAAPGIMWFEGNVHLDNGVNNTTILASGNVSTGGAFRGVSVNYAAFDEVCLAEGDHLAGDPIQADYSARFGAQYPTNLCDMSNNTYLPIQTGNIGIAAGGFDPNGDGTFSGGDISLSALNEVWGLVLAGGIFQTGGDTSVYGSVSAAVQGSKGEEKNRLGGATTVDLTRATDTYNPTAAPDMGGGGNTGGGGGAVNNGSEILWTKYL